MNITSTVRANLARRRAHALEAARFRDAFHRFWVGDDDCWDDGAFDPLATVALERLAVADVPGAVIAVREEALYRRGMTLSAASENALRDFFRTELAGHVDLVETPRTPLLRHHLAV